VRVCYVGVEEEGFGLGGVGFVFGLGLNLLVCVAFGKGRGINGDLTEGWLTSAWRMR
jgi:hypothetical protein